jgi:ribosome-associated heat shock protein Hsp15
LKRPGSDRDEGAAPLPEIRLDVFLDVACLLPTRSKAAAACAGGKVDLNGHSAAAHRLVRPGDTLEITFAAGRRRFVVRALADRHIPKAAARALVEETTPPLPPELQEARRLERLLAPRRDAGSGKLSKKERRDREKLRGF